MSYYIQIVNRIKEELKGNEYPPTFAKKEIHKGSNCYAYALNISIKDKRKRLYFPGCISDENEENEIFSTESLMERLKKDLDFLGLSYRENDNSLKQGEYRIAVYATPSICYDMPIGFHFSRQNKDGYWSEKRNWKDKPQKLDYCGVKPPDIPLQAYFKTVLIIKKK